MRGQVNSFPLISVPDLKPGKRTVRGDLGGVLNTAESLGHLSHCLRGVTALILLPRRSFPLPILSLTTTHNRFSFTPFWQSFWVEIVILEVLVPVAEEIAV